MNADKWQDMKQLFASALELRPEERETFLHNHCGDDVLIAELKALLSAHESTQSSSSLVDKSGK